MIQSIGESKHRIIANKTLHRTAFPQFRIFLTLSVKPGADCYTQLLPLANSEFKAAIESIEEVLFRGWNRRRTAESGKEGIERKEAYSRWARELTVGQAESVRLRRGWPPGYRIGCHPAYRWPIASVPIHRADADAVRRSRWGQHPFHRQ